MVFTVSAYALTTSQHWVWPFRWALERTRSSRSHSHCPWAGRRVRPISAAPPKLQWTSSIYMPPTPGTHHGIPWNLPLAPSPHRMVGTASPSQHQRFRHHLDSRYLHNSPQPSVAITVDHWHMAMSSSMTRFCWHRACPTNYTISNARHSTSMTGSSGPTTITTIQQSARSPSPKASCSRGMPAGPQPR